jgi:hypothetical protein
MNVAIIFCTAQTQNGKIKVHRQFGYKFLNTKNSGKIHEWGEKKNIKSAT